MAIFTREEILKAQKLEEKTITTSRGEWVIREITKDEQRRATDAAKAPYNYGGLKKGEVDTQQMQMHLLVVSSVDPKLEDSDIPMLGKLPLSVIVPVLQGITEINGLDEEAVQDAEKTFPQNSRQEVDGNAG